MYKIASQNQQRRVDFIAPAELAGGTEILTPFQQLGDKKRAATNLQARMKMCSDPEEKKRLGQENFALQNEIISLKAMIGKAPPTIASVFMHEARRILPKGQFDAIYRAARAECDRTEERA